MSTISALIKVCRVKKLPLDIENLIFEYLLKNGRRSFMDGYNVHFNNFHNPYLIRHNRYNHLNYKLPALLNNFIDRNMFRNKFFTKNHILLLNRLSIERWDIHLRYNELDLIENGLWRNGDLENMIQRPFRLFINELAGKRVKRWKEWNSDGSIDYIFKYKVATIIFKARSDVIHLHQCIPTGRNDSLPRTTDINEFLQEFEDYKIIIKLN